MPGSEVFGSSYFGEYSGSAGVIPVLIDWPADTNSGYLLTASSTLDASMNLPDILVNPGQIYTFSIYAVPAVGTLPRTIQLTLMFYDVSGNQVGSTLQSTFLEAAQSFVRGNHIRALAPIGAYKAIQEVTVVNPETGDEHYFGALLFEPSPYLAPYFDASFPPPDNYLWEGTPNKSVSDYYENLYLKLARISTTMEEYVPVGSTYSLIFGARAFANSGLNG